jgi:hypothetical protein
VGGADGAVGVPAGGADAAVAVVAGNSARGSATVCEDDAELSAGMVSAIAGWFRQQAYLREIPRNQADFRGSSEAGHYVIAPGRTVL